MIDVIKIGFSNWFKVVVTKMFRRL